jgi:DNA-binding transcriptional regulator YiaG
MVSMTAVDDLVERVRLRQQLPPPRIRRAIREAHGATQSEFAEALHVSRQTFIYWETGRRNPRRGSAEQYVRLLLALQGGGTA